MDSVSRLPVFSVRNGFTQMLIVHVIADLTTGGAEMMMKRLIEAHRGSSEFEHYVISLAGLGRIGPELQAAGITVEALGMRGPLDLLKVLRQLVKAFRRLQPDIVHCWMYHANLLGGLAARLSGRRQVIWGIRAGSFDATMGVSRTTTFLRRALGPVSRFLPEVIVHVAHAARLAHEKIGYAASKGLVIPNGYLPSRAKSYPDVRARLGIGADEVVIGSIGRFNPAKDPRTFIEAAAIVAGARPESRFLMIGPGMNPNAELDAWIAARKLSEKFVLLDDCKDVDECLAAMDIFCLHSVTEAFPNVVAEAMSAGVPCVVSDVGDAAFLLNGAGLVVPPRNPKALADGILELIEVGPEMRRETGARGQQRIASHFSLDAIVRQYEGLYRDMVEGSHPRK